MILENIPFINIINNITIIIILSLPNGSTLNGGAKI